MLLVVRFSVWCPIVYIKPIFFGIGHFQTIDILYFIPCRLILSIILDDSL